MIGPIKGEKKIYSQAKKNQFNYQWFQIEFDFGDSTKNIFNLLSCEI